MVEPALGRVCSFHPLPPPAKLTEQVLPGIGLCNGIVWHLRYRTRLYCTDGLNNRILSFVYKVAERRVTGNNGIVFDLDKWIGNQLRPLYYGHAMLGRMTIDTKGRLWVPLHGGSHVLLIIPGAIISVQKAIRIPAVKVSACVFGGTDKNILYVSTLPCGADEMCPGGDQGGRIFAVNLWDVSGRDAKPFVMPPRTP
ncbi:regucalcin-like [Belonocnema kinseyi]|uniref:regucalcin-like n=1 Tax=Belonocnema kinseyi TaxID=2817044 RepID=UPI00143E05F7|nr:regucalcin-like [Belonocnema kinseyi]